jgi:hypothetical protein
MLLHPGTNCQATRRCKHSNDHLSNFYWYSRPVTLEREALVYSLELTSFSFAVRHSRVEHAAVWPLFALYTLTRAQSCIMAQLLDNEQGRGLSALCDAIRRNDPAMSKVHLDLQGTWEPQSTRSLGEALLHNTCITTMTIAIKSNQFNQVSNIDVTNCPLLRYFRTSSSLRELRLWRGCPEAALPSHASNDYATSLICMALAESLSLQKLDICEVPVTATAMAHLLQTTNTLQNLATDLYGFEHADHADQVQLAEAFAGNRSFEVIILSYFCAPVLADLLVQHLGLHSTLRTLRLNHGWTCRWFESLGRLIEATSALQDFQLQGFSFTENEMQMLVNGLISSRSVTTLELGECKLDMIASRLFTEFVQTRCNSQEPDGNRLRELRLYSCPMGEQGMGEAAAAMLVNSALQVLDVDGYQYGHFDCIKFFAALSSNGATIRLPCLKLRFRKEQEVDALLHYLATCLHLRELVVTLVHESVNSQRALCRALYKNASVYRVELCYDTFDHSTSTMVTDPALTAAESRMLESSCARNLRIPQLLAAPNLEETAQDNATDGTALALFPSLFYIARQAPRTTLNNMLIGLLATTTSKVGGVLRGVRRTFPQQALDDAH